MSTLNQSLTLRVAADAWQGDPSFVVTVDGQQVGGVQTASASHADGQWQDITLTGDFDADPSKVAVTFTNDAFGGSAATDRNLYVQSLTLNGNTYLGSTVPNTLGPKTSDSAALYAAGTLTFNTTQAAKARNTLTLRVAADAWQGDPSFVVTVDGQQVGGVQTASASHADGQWQDITLTGDFDADPSKVAVTFTNDAFGGSAATDRNLYVQSLTLNGNTYLGSTVPNTLGPKTSDSAALYAAGTLTFNTTQAAKARNTLTLRVAADAWQGDPSFVVTVDGQQVGGVQTASASHADGQWQDITLTGDFDADPSKVAVTFTNDAFGGSAATDRNLYVQSLTLNGNTYLGSTVPNTLGPKTSDSAALYAAGTLTFNTTQAVTGTAVPPPVPVVAAFAAPLTKSTEPVVSGTAGAGLTIAVYLDGGTVPLATVTSTATGAWSYTPTRGLADGTHSFTARAIDAVGNVSAVSAGQSVTVDTTPPSAPAITPFAAAISRTNEPTVAGNAAAGSKVSVYIDGGATPAATVAAGADGRWSYTPTKALMDGAHSFTARATDAAGNVSAVSAGQSVTVDTTPPSERVTALSVAGDDVIDAVEGRGGVIVTGTLSASLAAGDSVTVSVGGVSTTVPTAGVQGMSFTVDLAKPAGGWVAGTATAAVKDRAGNASASAVQGYTAPPAPSGALALLGVNLSGGEYSADKLPGVVGTNYTYPTHDEVDYYASKGLNVIRLPFLWERLQPTEDGPLSQTELDRIDDVVDYANSKGMKVILDPHDYGSGYGNLIGSAGTPDSAFADFWGKLAGHYATDGDVMFGLMNEPQQSQASTWLGAANAAIQAIRQAGATAQEVLVPGTYYDGAATWTTTDNAGVIGTGIKDPANDFVFEVHQYLDSDGSGTHDSVVSPTIGSSRLAAVTQWAQNTGNKLFLGEFGVGQGATSLSAMGDMLGFMKQHSDVWQGAADWLAGPWVGDNIYTIEPTGLGTGHVIDRPQMGVLQHYAPGTF